MTTAMQKSDNPTARIIGAITLVRGDFEALMELALERMIEGNKGFEGMTVGDIKTLINDNMEKIKIDLPEGIPDRRRPKHG